MANMNTKSRASGQASKKKRKVVSVVAIAHVLSTSNNTIITIADPNGDTLAICSGGVCQKGSRKSTPHAAQEAGKLVGAKVMAMGVDELKVIMRGIGLGKSSAVRGLSSAGLKVLVISDQTKIPHGGRRKRKKRRV